MTDNFSNLALFQCVMRIDPLQLCILIDIVIMLWYISNFRWQPKGWSKYKLMPKQCLGFCVMFRSFLLKTFFDLLVFEIGFDSYNLEKKCHWSLLWYSEDVACIVQLVQDVSLSERSMNYHEKERHNDSDQKYCHRCQLVDEKVAKAETNEGHDQRVVLLEVAKFALVIL